MREPGHGQLVLVATPIGNLGDLSPRAAEVLAQADLIACEDTRRTRGLLSALAIPAGGPAGDRLVSLHAHNERARVDQVRALVAQGALVAVVSDAGTPGISDPGSVLVAELSGEGYAVSVVPGPSSVISALVVSGLATDRFCVEGFLPRKGPQRRQRIATVMGDARTTVVLESPMRLLGTLAELGAIDADRPIAVVRELTKVYEEVWRGTLAEAETVFAERGVRGEVVLVIGGAPPPSAPSEADIDAAVRERLAHGDGPRQVAAALSGEMGVARRTIYDVALRLRSESGSSD